MARAQGRKIIMRVSLWLSVLLCVVCLSSRSAIGASVRNTVLIEQAWARATPPTAKTGVVYFRLRNTGKSELTLVAAKCDCSARASIHSMTMDGGVMRMRLEKSLTVKAGQTVELAPGGWHLMLENLRAPLRDGDMIKISLIWQNGDTLNWPITISKDAPTNY
jgi:periplasmic copper chaperone A